MQSLIAHLIVTVALLYAAWLFMPRAGRGWLIAIMIAILPASQRARFERFRSNAQSAGCSTCKGCATDEPATPAFKPIRLHRR